MNCPYQIEIPDRGPVGDRFYCLHRFHTTSIHILFVSFLCALCGSKLFYPLKSV